jgi:hypothetical protein
LVQCGAKDKGATRETAMKVTIDIDCTPEEARAFLGLPDLGPAQQAYVEEFQKRMMASLGAMDPDAMAKAWMPDGMAGWEKWRNLWQPQSGDDEK